MSKWWSGRHDILPVRPNANLSVVTPPASPPNDSLMPRIGRDASLRWWATLIAWAGDTMWDIDVMSHKEQVTIGERGRLVLPASVRSALGLNPGTRMLLSTEDDGSLRLRPYRTVADESRGLYADLAKSTSLVDELLAERRAEAKREK